jgi:3-hydroxyisobutyrate dehydrogenase-like beta-hydroxyacid dehydrogenase
MGIAVATSAKNSGNEVFWVSENRSAATRQRASDAGLQDAGTLAKLCELCPVIVSVCPPEFAEPIANQIANLSFQGTYVDANAISPERARRIAQHSKDRGIRFVDGGIIGMPPTERGQTWLYLSGEDAPNVATYFSAGPIETEVLSGGIGHASALKMCFAAYSKGTVALAAAVLNAAENLGVSQDLKRQWERGGPSLPKLQAGISRARPKAWRYIAEMREIAATFQSAGMPSGFHHAAEEIFRGMDGTRQSRDRLTNMSDRRSVEVPGLEHVNPIPNASRIGPFLVSGGIFGKNPQTGQVPEGIEAQCEQTFANIRKVLEAGGATPENVIKLSVWLKDMANRPIVNKYWLQLFPEDHSRPARHTFPTPDLRAPLLVECEIMAVIPDKK